MNKDSSLFPHCTWFHLQKVISRYKKKKKHCLVFNRKQPELLLIYSILFSLCNTVHSTRLAHAGL